MDRDIMVKRLFKGIVVTLALLIIAVLVGAFFALGGNNPLLIYAGKLIDLVLVVITVFFAMGIGYTIYAYATGNGQPIFASAKKTRNRKNDEIPELTELLDSLDATDN